MATPNSNRRLDSTRERPRVSVRRSPSPWKHGKIPVIGLVGGIGAGKSSAAALLAEGGAHVLDADRIGHALLDQKPARQSVVQVFGPDVLAREDGDSIDRARLGARVFGNPEALRKLEQILHPRMRRTFEKAIARQQRAQPVKAIVLDAAILFEAGWNDLCDLIVFVDAPRALRVQRVASARGWDAAALRLREANQGPLEEKRAHADLVISNTAGLDELRTQLEPLWSTIRSRYRAALAKHGAAVARSKRLTEPPSTPPTPKGKRTNR
jgi:dephospho-CoA kinase